MSSRVPREIAGAPSRSRSRVSARLLLFPRVSLDLCRRLLGPPLINMPSFYCDEDPPVKRETRATEIGKRTFGRWKRGTEEMATSVYALTVRDSGDTR